MTTCTFNHKSLLLLGSVAVWMQLKPLCPPCLSYFAQLCLNAQLLERSAADVLNCLMVHIQSHCKHVAQREAARIQVNCFACVGPRGHYSSQRHFSLLHNHASFPCTASDAALPHG